MLTVLAGFIFETSCIQLLINNYNDSVGLTIFLVQRCAAPAQDCLSFGVCSSRPALLILFDIHKTP